MPTTMRLSMMVPLMLILAACGGDAVDSDTPPSEAEVVPDLSTPEATLIRMLELAEAGDWDTYVNDFYGEQSKFQDARDRQKLIRRFRQRWGPSVVEQLSMLIGVKAELLDEGNRASFQMPDENTFFLYKDELGRWTFHL